LRTQEQLELKIRFFRQNIQDISGTRGLAGIGFVPFRNWEHESNQNLTSHYKIAVLENIQQHSCSRAERYMLELHSKQNDAPKFIAIVLTALHFENGEVNGKTF
jgi:hypothetical protein